MIRSLYGAARIPNAPEPFDTAHFRVFYPAARTGSDTERLTGELPPDPTLLPFPVVVILPGANVPPDSYSWLATRLATEGMAAVVIGGCSDVITTTVGPDRLSDGC